jgi:hypothetical protein
MFNLASLLIGILALPWLLLGSIPFVGALNWLILPWGVLGLILGVLSSRTSGRNLNLVVLGIAAVRLMLGGGVI